MALVTARQAAGMPCPRCDNPKNDVYGHRVGCTKCNPRWSITRGTVMADTKLPLTTWFRAMHLMTSTKQCISAVELGRRLGVTYPTGWYLHKRLRHAMREESDRCQTRLTRRTEVSRNAFSCSSSGWACSLRAASRNSGDRPRMLLSMANRAAIRSNASSAIADAVAWCGRGRAPGRWCRRRAARGRRERACRSPRRTARAGTPPGRPANVARSSSTPSRASIPDWRSSGRYARPPRTACRVHAPRARLQAHARFSMSACAPLPAAGKTPRVRVVNRAPSPGPLAGPSPDGALTERLLVGQHPGVTRELPGTTHMPFGRLGQRDRGRAVALPLMLGSESMGSDSVLVRFRSKCMALVGRVRHPDGSCVQNGHLRTRSINDVPKKHDRRGDTNRAGSRPRGHLRAADVRRRALRRCGPIIQIRR